MSHSGLEVCKTPCNRAALASEKHVRNIFNNNELRPNGYDALCNCIPTTSGGKIHNRLDYHKLRIDRIVDSCAAVACRVGGPA